MEGVRLSRAPDGPALPASSHRVSSVLAHVAEDWCTFVAYCVAEGLAGVECLSGVPGLAGATPVQNVGAYGQEVSETIVWGHRLGP